MVPAAAPDRRAVRHRFTLPLQVRDYECDLQGIVNNAEYLHYLEHARHEFLKTLGLDFAALTAAGVRLVVVRSEVDYEQPLRSGDAFVVGVNIERVSRLQIAFLQEIHRLPDRTLVLRAKVIATALNERGRPALSPAVQPLFTASA